MKITVKHAGKFKVTEPDEYQCGEVGQEDYNYKIEVTGNVKQLQKESGFLVNNKWIQDIFNDFGKAKSGERMASELALSVIKLCKDWFYFTPSYVRVEIIANENSSFIAEVV